MKTISYNIALKYLVSQRQLLTVTKYHIFKTHYHGEANAILDEII